MEIFILPPLSICGTNSYIVASESKNAVLIDAPDKADFILGQIADRGLTLKKILLTHGHYDHMGAAQELKEKTGCEVYIHALDREKLTDEEESRAIFHSLEINFVKCPNSIAVNDGDIIEQDELRFKVMHTPGHTVGSVCYIIGDVIFSGDTLFCESIGRTDFPGGSMEQMNASLRRLAALDGNYAVYPGHAMHSDLAHEKKYNAFMQAACK